MNPLSASPPIKRLYLVLLAFFCLLLPNIHTTALASQVVIPREIFLYLYSAVFILFLIQRKELDYNPFFIIAAIFLGWQGLSLAWSSDLPTGTESVLNASFFLLSAFAFYQIQDGGIRQILIKALIASVSVAAVIGILQNFDWNPLGIYQAAPPSSTFNNKNLAASASLLLLPLSLAQLLVSEQRGQRFLYSLAATSLLSFVLVAHTKGVWLAGLCLLAAVATTFLTRSSGDQRIFRQRLAERRFHLLGVVLISLTVFLAPGLRNAGDLKLENYTLASASAAFRLGFYRDALPLVAEHPIAGIGSGSLRREFRSQPGGEYEKQHAEGDRYLSRLHNDHLQYLVELGGVGLLLWTGLLVALFRTAFRLLISDGLTSNDKLNVYSLSLGVSGMLLHAMVSFPVRSVATGSLFWLAVGLLLSYQQSGRSLIPNHPVLARLKYPMVALLLALSVFAINNVTHRAIASYYTKQSADTLTSGYCFAAKFYLNNLLETANLDLKSAQLLALTYDYCGGEVQEKSRLMDRVLAFEPNHALALLVKADSVRQMGDTASAYQLYSHARQVNPKAIRAYLGMAEISVVENRIEDAIGQAKQALLIDSGNEQAKKILENLESN